MTRRIKRRRTYVDKMLEAAARLQAHGVAPAAYIVDVYHDDDCPLLAGTGPCDCDADLGEWHRAEAAEVV